MAMENGGRCLNMSADTFPQEPRVSITAVCACATTGRAPLSHLSGFVTGSKWRCEFLLVAVALQHWQRIPLHIKDPEWLVHDVVLWTDDYHKDKILQLFSPAVQNNPSCSRLTTMCSSWLNTMSVWPLVLSCCESAGLQNKKVLLQKASYIFKTF